MVWPAFLAGRPPCPWRLLPLLALLSLVDAKWRQQLSAHPAPGIFESVCVGRTAADEPPIVYMAGDRNDLKYVSAELSLGYPSQAPVFRDNVKFHGPNMAEPAPAQVVLRDEQSVQEMATRQAEERMNASETLDVHYMGGTTILMHSPCDFDDNLFLTLTEEGPMLHRAVLRAMRGAKKRPERLSLLLNNKCPHHAYRDELRDMLIGRDHSVFKVQPAALTCVERLVTPPPAWLKPERSLQQYFASLSERAREQHEEETARRASYQSKALREAVRRGQPPSCLSDEGEPLGACSAQASSQSYEAAAAVEAEAEQRGARPFKVAVIQRTSAERRIINLDGLIGALQRSLAVWTHPDTSPSVRANVEEIVRNGRVETLFLDNVELWEQIRRVQDVDVLIGVTGSGLSMLAFLKPGSIVIELASHTYETDLVQSLILRSHGALLRGLISYRKCYVKPLSAFDFDAANAAVRLDMLSHAQFNSWVLTGEDGEFRKDFHALVNTSHVVSVVSSELRHRMSEIPGFSVDEDFL